MAKIVAKISTSMAKISASVAKTSASVAKISTNVAKIDIVHYRTVYMATENGDHLCDYDKNVILY